jgi:hypothetical protein
MVAQDTLLHELAPSHGRAVIFSTKDLLVAGIFAASAFLVGGGIYLLGVVGVGEPYRWALALVGGVIVLTALGVARIPRAHTADVS